jgi:LmbE family N-acetylglucosaminyl deacetylase
MRLRSTLLALALAAAFVGRPALDAQVRPIYDYGADGLMQVLEQLQTTASVLHTGAHPDDEDSAFLAREARGDRARVAYLALNRGEGGQNIIGPELFDALGVIRTEELLQARRLDGGQQFFTRTFDYGFSKSRAEAAAKWNEHDVLDDMVRVIRMFRPLVIYSRFTGTPADGHGHHQLAGYLTPLAFKAAGDPKELERGALPEAARAITRSLDLSPTDEVTRYRQARLLHAQKNDTAALAVYEAIVRARATTPPVFYAYACVDAARLYEQRHQPARAIDLYMTATTTFGADQRTKETAQRALARLPRAAARP